MFFNIGEANSIANQFLIELRDNSVQQDRLRFRRNVERLGEIMAYEISKKLNYTQRKVETSLGSLSIGAPNSPVLITILRAGLPYFTGFQNFFDHSECGFIGAYRKEGGSEITINLDYMASPSLNGKTIVLIDPMLATGKSLIRSINELFKNGQPNHIHIATLIAAPEGITFVQKELMNNYSLWTFAVDEKLNEQSYIVPGLGDAGDLSFGDKM
jgi:uracil phosphoribosyltransferase